MRLTHEAIRSGINNLEEITQNLSPDTIGPLQENFAALKRVIELHANQEDQVFYPPLEERHPKLTHAFSEEHEAEHQAFSRLSTLIDALNGEGPDLGTIKTAMEDWIKQHRAHLVHEEEILMKILPKTFTFVESVKIVRSILEYDLKEFEEFQLNWVFQRLKGPQRKVYLSMLQGCSPEGKFPDFVAKIRPQLHEEELQVFEAESLLN